FSSDAGGTSPISDVTLSGQDQTIYIKMPVKIVDARGTGAGWAVSLYADPFANSGHSLQAPTITAITNISAVTDSSLLNGTSNSSALGTPVGSMPATSGSAQPLVTASNAGGFGMGTY